MKASGVLGAQEALDAYVVSLGADAYKANVGLCLALRKSGFCVEMDHEGKSVKAQMRQADKMHARFVLIRGEDELKKGLVQVKGMAGRTEQSVRETEIPVILKAARPEGSSCSG